jgi:ADP-ribosylglycohydrolase
VPLALALATVLQSAEAAILLATDMGGDSDSVASVAGAILGARSPGSVKDEWYAIAERVNCNDLLRLSEDLSALRR